MISLPIIFASFKGAVNGMFVVPPCSIYLRLLFVLLSNTNRLKFKDVIHSKYFETICTFESYSSSQWLYSPTPKIKKGTLWTLFTLSSMNLMNNYRVVFFNQQFIMSEFFFKRLGWLWSFSNFFNLFFYKENFV